MLLVYHKTFILAPVLLLIHEPFMSLSLQARRNEKNSGGGGKRAKSLSKMLANLVS